MTNSTFAEDGREAWRNILKVLAALGLLKIAKQLLENGRLTMAQVIQALSALGTLGWLGWN